MDHYQLLINQIHNKGPLIKIFLIVVIIMLLTKKNMFLLICLSICSIVSSKHIQSELQKEVVSGSCAPGCQICNDSSSCQTCLENFYINSIYSLNQCVTCLTTNCRLCKTSTQCQSCVSGYANIEGICISCQNLIQNCENCTIQNSNQQTCLSCNQMFFLDENFCFPCPPFCLYCKNESFCTTCFFGFQSNITSGECQAALPNCAYQKDSNICQTCSPGFYPTDGSCSPCKVLNCLQCSQTSSCSECQIGFFFTNNFCLPCQGGCQSCNDSSSCLTCFQGYYIDRLGICQPCLDICFRCQLSNITGNIDCLECREGNYLGYISELYAQTCLNCDIEGCQICKPEANGGIICLSCGNGNSYVDDYCIPCPYHCLSCSNTTTCIKCFSGYSLINEICEECPFNCLNCSSTSSCTLCSSNFYLNEGFCDSCSSALTNCSICSSNITCDVCFSGFYVNSQHTCDVCPENCSFCSSSQQCNQCHFGLYLTNERTCQPCLEVCKNCLSESVCTLCQAGNYLELGQCLSCLQGCTLCLDSAHCQTCLQGYSIDGGICSKGSGLKWWEIALITLGGVLLLIFGSCLIQNCINRGQEKGKSYVQLVSDSSR